MHPLKKAYNAYIQAHYDGAYDGKEDEEKAEAVAQRVHKLGLSYDQFAELACSLWDRWATQKGWKYPLWNVITSDASFDRIEKFLDYAQVLDTPNELREEIFYEQAYILDYIDWWMGVRDVQPDHELHVSMSAKIGATERVCEQYGIPFITTDVNFIASQVEDLHGNC